MEKHIIQRGAEAILYREDGTLVKDRVVKGYRLPELDSKIRKLRTRSEARLLDTAVRAGIDVPRVLGIEDNTLKMDFIDGRRVKDVLNEMGENERDSTCLLIGEALARLHGAGICHGDFTTSNMILAKNVGAFEEEGIAENGADKATKAVGGDEKVSLRLYIIDFGLGKLSKKVEDQAVDLYLLYEALKAAHFEYLSHSWQYILKSYGDNYKGANAVMQRFKVIEKRRRYKGE